MFQVYRVKAGEVIMICWRTVKYLFPWRIYATTDLKGLKFYLWKEVNIFVPQKILATYIWSLKYYCTHITYCITLNCGGGNFGGKCQELAYIGTEILAYLKIVIISIGAKSFLKKWWLCVSSAWSIARVTLKRVNRRSMNL